MIRLDYYVQRKAELTQEEFQARWLQQHGKLWVKHADTLNVRRYSQLHDWPDHPVSIAYRNGWGVTGVPHDGVSTCYFASYKAFEEAIATEEGQAAMAEILADELEFIDTSRCMLSFGIVHPVINPRQKIVATEDSEIMKGIYFPEGLPQFDVDTIQRHWIAVHCWLTNEHCVNSPNMQYYQVHAREYPVLEEMRKARNMTRNPLHFGHAEAWSCEAEFEKAAQNPVRAETAHLFMDDIDAFADKNKGYFVVGKEFNLVDEDIYTEPLPQPGDI